MTRMPLPIDDVLPRLVTALETAPNVVLAAPPGAGKTTRVPLALLGASWTQGKILMLEPRRLAARAAAERLASEIGEKVGQSVGYRIRGETKVSQAGRIEVITEGILTRMLQSDPELSGVSALIFDEVHERSIHTDLGLALSLEVQEALRPDLRLVAMSATLDTGAFARIMRNAAVIESEGRTFPVETRWLARPWRRPGDKRRHIAEPMAALIAQALDDAEGDVLAFLPGAGEINRVAGLLERRGDVLVQPLYGALPAEKQRAVLRPPPKEQRRVVLATSIAETSLTVPGIKIVVDSGLSRRSRIDHGTGLSRLVTLPVSRAESDQRRGRAGRIAPGVCYRLWTKGEEGGLVPFAPPEILEADLAPMALELAVWGTENPEDLAFLTPPPEKAYRVARDLLEQLGALDGGRITGYGRAMAVHPAHPRLAHMLESAKAGGQGAEAGLIAAVLSERDPLANSAGSDLRTRLTAIAKPPPQANRATIDRIRKEAKRLSPATGPPRRPEDHAGALIALAYPDRIAQRRDGEAPRYLLTSGRGATLDAHDPLARERLLIATDLEDGPEARIRLAVPLDEADLRNAAGARIEIEQTVLWSTRHRRIEARTRERLGSLALSDTVWKDAPDDLYRAALIEAVRDLGLACLPWSKAATALRTRAAWLNAQDIPDIPDLRDAALRNNLEDWLGPHLLSLRKVEDLARLNLHDILRSHLAWSAHQVVDREAPATLSLPHGARVAVSYDAAGPKISVRVQDLYGLTAHPVLGPKRLPVRIEMLSPAQRPVQITTDLPGFWAGSYGDVRKDMRARYPRHDWPEDPANATPRRLRRSDTKK